MDIATYRFKSGLTQKESEALVDRLTEKYLGEEKDFEMAVSMLKHHLTRAVRDEKDQRAIISACLG